MRNKTKYLTTIGTIVATVTPIVAVISCGSSQVKKDPNKIQKDIHEKVGKLLKNANLNNQGLRTVSEIATGITNLKSLQDATGVDLSGVELNGSTLKILATGDANGKLTIEIAINTPGVAKDVKSTQDVMGKTDAQITVEIDNTKKQKEVKDAIDILLKNAKINSQELRTVSEIATGITNLKSLQDATGVDLSGVHLSGSTLKISATGETNGKLTIEVVINTPGVTKDVKSTQDVMGKTNSQVKAEKMQLIVNYIPVKQNAKSGDTDWLDGEWIDGAAFPKIPNATLSDQWIYPNIQSDVPAKYDKNTTVLTKDTVIRRFVSITDPDYYKKFLGFKTDLDFWKDEFKTKNYRVFLFKRDTDKWWMVIDIKPDIK